ncbi:MAG: hypothetical protein D6693_01610 [Planctomycetota bacterium]|nr:MAG: hypothetical protein D6693_01610 [Planctomycetota bacterium]
MRATRHRRWRSTARAAPAPRLCAEAGGAGVLSAEAAEDAPVWRSILGVQLDPGEVVILVCRRSFWAGAAGGLVVAVATAGLVWALGRATGRPGVTALAGPVAVALASAFALLDHLRRLYVLTDRRVIRRDRRLLGVVSAEAPLADVRRVDLAQGDLQARVGVGTIVFVTGGGPIVWSSVGEAQRVREIAQHAVKRYGGSARGV